MRKTSANSTYKKLAGQWLNEVLCFVSCSLLADSLMLRNRQLLVAAKRYALCYKDPAGMKRNLIIDSIWLGGIAIILTSLIIIILKNSILSTGSVEFQLHDTYLVAELFHIIGSGFIFVTFLIFGVRATKSRFEKVSTSVIFLIVTALFIISITLLTNQISKLAILNGGWTIYPPLSAIPQDEPITENSNLLIFNNILAVFQSILIIILTISSIITGKKMKHNA